MLTTWCLFLFALLAGLFLIITGIHGQREYRRREDRENVVATGTVVWVREEQKRNRYGWSVIRYPTVLFMAGTQEVEAEGPGTKDRYEPGQKVDIRYEAGNPVHFHMADDDLDERLGRKLVWIGVIVLLCSSIWTILCWYNPILRL